MTLNKNQTKQRLQNYFENTILLLTSAKINSDLLKQIYFEKRSV